MRLVAVAVVLACAVGCTSKLKETLNAGAPPAYIEAYAKDEGISVEEARRKLVESRRHPTSGNPAIAQVQQQQRARGATAPKGQFPK